MFGFTAPGAKGSRFTPNILTVGTLPNRTTIVTPLCELLGRVRATTERHGIKDSILWASRIILQDTSYIPHLVLTLSHGFLKDLEFQLVRLVVIPRTNAHVRVSENLGKEGFLIFTFDDQEISGHQMYSGYYPVVWR